MPPYIQSQFERGRGALDLSDHRRSGIEIEDSNRYLTIPPGRPALNLDAGRASDGQGRKNHVVEKDQKGDQSMSTDVSDFHEYSHFLASACP